MDTLVFYTSDYMIAQTSLALGFVAPASSDDTAMVLVNPSDSYQANDVTVHASGDDSDQLYLSTDGDTFGPSIVVGDIPPNANSAPFWLRRVTPSTAGLGAATASLTATPDTWSDVTDASTSTNVSLDADVELDIDPDETEERHLAPPDPAEDD